MRKSKAACVFFYEVKYAKFNVPLFLYTFVIADLLFLHSIVTRMTNIEKNRTKTTLKILIINLTSLIIYGLISAKGWNNMVGFISNIILFIVLFFKDVSKTPFTIFVFLLYRCIIVLIGIINYITRHGIS